MINLSGRLLELQKLIPRCNTFADIGSDHGYLPCGVLSSNIAEKAVITDISEKNLEKAKKKILKNGLENKAVFYTTPGFCGIKESIDIAVIAGMGAMEIIKILETAQDLPPVIIFQPMKNTPALRIYLTDKLNYGIAVDKTVCCDGRYYDIIKAQKEGAKKLTEEEILLGVTNITEKSPAFINYLKKELKRLKKIEDKGISSEQSEKYINIIHKFLNKE